MSYWDDLLDQAAALSSCDRRRPRQANVRRAISAAYYAVFHRLVGAAVALIVPARMASVRHQLSRKFVHNTMKKVAQAASRATDPDIVEVAGAFVRLQEARHRADYDFSRTFTRIEANAVILSARRAIARWEELKDRAAADRFLVESLVNRFDPA